MATLTERVDAVVAAVDAEQDPRPAIEALRRDLDLSGAGAISVVRDVDTDDGTPQPPVVSAFTPEGAEG